jgi:hypothetical protein
MFPFAGFGKSGLHACFRAPNLAVTQVDPQGGMMIFSTFNMTQWDGIFVVADEMRKIP